MTTIFHVICTLQNGKQFCVSIKFSYKSTSILSWMRFSDWLHYSLGTLRYATARSYYMYGYFGQEGLGWQRHFTCQTKMIKILLYGNDMCSLCMSLQKRLHSRKPWDFILLPYEIGLINDDLLLLYPSYAQSLDLPFRTWSVEPPKNH